MALKVAVSLDAAAPGFLTYAELLAEDHGRRYESAGDPLLVIYTSVLPGLPKGVMKEPSTDRITIEYFMDVRGARAATADDVYLVTMPMHHGAGPAQMWSAKRAGAKAVLLRKYDPVAALDAIEKHRVTHWTGVPTMYKRMAALPPEALAGRDLSSIRTLSVGAAPVSDQLKNWIIDRFGECLWKLPADRNRHDHDDAARHAAAQTGLERTALPAREDRDPRRGRQGAAHRRDRRDLDLRRRRSTAT